MVAYIHVHPSGVTQWLRPGTCCRLVLVWKCPCREVNLSAEGLLCLPWVVTALLHCLSSHAHLLLLSSVCHATVLSFINSVSLLKPKFKTITLMLLHFPLVVLFCLFVSLFWIQFMTLVCLMYRKMLL